ncbi:YndM family protein [Virgibacillus kekensis]|uniref:YndM family protein n=1 Tax=Virgibacillus kekensis TaxID=202261 RepID=A0ABV9DEL8_9BACI
MRHLAALGIKFVVISVAVFSILGIFYNATLTNLFWVSLLVTGIAYFVGDLFVLKRYGNLIATIGDFPLAFLSIWLLGMLFIERDLPILPASLFAAFFITLCEPLLHSFIINHEEKAEELPASGKLQTETAEEIEPDIDKNKSKE